MATETEIKLAWNCTPDEAAALLEAQGYRAATPRVLERDQLFDGATGDLQRADQVLRLRRVGSAEGTRAFVTFKGPAARTPYKSREEIEFLVSDADALCSVLARLGYHPGFRYEKFRTEFRAPGEPGLATLDETPMGVFLELEGPAYWIDATAARLGFARAAYLTASYPRLYREYRARNSGAPEHMVFPPKDREAPDTKQP